MTVRIPPQKNEVSIVVNCAAHTSALRSPQPHAGTGTPMQQRAFSCLLVFFTHTAPGPPPCCAGTQLQHNKSRPEAEAPCQQVQAPQQHPQLHQRGTACCSTAQLLPAPAQQQRATGCCKVLVKSAHCPRLVADSPSESQHAHLVPRARRAPICTQTKKQQ